MIQQVADFNGSTWTSLTGGSAYYLALDASGNPIFTTTESTSAYWTVTTKVVAGVTYYQFKNADDKTFVYTHNAGTPTEKRLIGSWLNQVHLR